MSIMVSNNVISLVVYSHLTQHISYLMLGQRSWEPEKGMPLLHKIYNIAGYKSVQLLDFSVPRF